MDVNWSPDGRFCPFRNGYPRPDIIVPLPPGEALPKIPAGGFHSEQEVARTAGSAQDRRNGVVPGPSPDVYAFYRGTTQRNLYRIPIP